MFVGELNDYYLIRETIRETDVVVSFLRPGSRFLNGSMPVASGYEYIMRTMNELGLCRLIMIGTPAIRFKCDGASMITTLPRVITRLMRPKAYNEINKIAEIAKVSGLQWTIVRFVSATNGLSAGDVKVTFGDRMVNFTIPRVDIAAFVIKEITNRNFIRSMPLEVDNSLLTWNYGLVTKIQIILIYSNT